MFIPLGCTKCRSAVGRSKPLPYGGNKQDYEIQQQKKKGTWPPQQNSCIR